MQLDWINILAFLILATVVVTLVAMAATFVAGRLRGRKAEGRRQKAEVGG